MPRTERQRRMLDAMGIRVFEPEAARPEIEAAAPEVAPKRVPNLMAPGPCQALPRVQGGLPRSVRGPMASHAVEDAASAPTRSGTSNTSDSSNRLPSFSDANDLNNAFIGAPSKRTVPAAAASG